jgi:rhodanese-related sulfurtransferase
VHVLLLQLQPSCTQNCRRGQRCTQVALIIENIGLQCSWGVGTGRGTSRLRGLTAGWQVQACAKR